MSTNKYVFDTAEAESNAQQAEHDQLVGTGLFRELSEDEVEEFKQAARDGYVAGAKISPFWHPIYREECKRINKEKLNDV